ncbi:uncharacterized protein LOC123306127 [Chrysoperla carnea]|uniref:uncharacterized protein LOC123306127 n=1 Tax=Chrysoperla carnea TaxID=189513 RepID=UPI001D075316|nr:uncharacterized protein LOC123306127 [Chrysoperla carnea]XP_044743949.1 uncharacterized protein LOC123306127 [Chrysoperla carnea]
MAFNMERLSRKRNLFASYVKFISIFVLLELLLNVIGNCNCEYTYNRNSQQSISKDNRKSYRESLCPPTFIRLSNKCYYLSDTSETWLDAFYKCKDKKSELATINQAFEDRQLKKILQQGKSNTRWIGGILNGETWSWGKTADSITYNGFIKALPNITHDGKLYCVAMDATKRYRWTPENCFNSNYFICQKLQNRRKNNKPIPMRKYNNNGIRNEKRRKTKPKKINKNINNYEINNNVIPETQNDVAYTNTNSNAYAYTKKPRQMVNLLKSVSRRCRDRDATVLKHINSTLSDDECIEFFIERWQRRQRKARDNRTKQLSRGKVKTITPKTLIQYRNSELHPARIEETHDVYIH